MYADFLSPYDRVAELTLLRSLVVAGRPSLPVMSIGAGRREYEVGEWPSAGCKGLIHAPGRNRRMLTKVLPKSARAPADRDIAR